MCFSEKESMLWEWDVRCREAVLLFSPWSCYFPITAPFYSFLYCTTAICSRWQFFLKLLTKEWHIVLHCLSVDSYISFCGASVKQASSCDHLCYYSYKQLFPHQPCGVPVKCHGERSFIWCVDIIPIETGYSSSWFQVRPPPF